MHGARDGLGRLVAALLTVTALLTAFLVQPAAADPVLGPPPATLTVSQRSTMAIATWPAVAASGYAVEYDVTASFLSARRVNTVESVALLTGLSPASLYYVRVAVADHATGATGAWGATVSFTTDAESYAYPAPVLDLESPTTTSVKATWKASGPDLDYQVSISTTKQPVTAKKTVAKASATFEKLKSGGKYFVSVRAVDADANPQSSWATVEYQVPESKPLRVASYNVKCHTCRGKGEKSWGQRRSAVASTILGQKPDVVGIQEASQSEPSGKSVSQFEDLANALGAPYKVTNYYRYNCARSNSPRGCDYVNLGASLGTRIMYNSETVELVKQGSVRLPAVKASNIDRFLAWAVFKQKSTGRLFVFGSTHLENGGKFKALRLRQVQAIIDSLKEISDDQLPTIMVGDFNTHKWISGGNKPYDRMVAAGFKDPLGNTYKSRHTAPGAFVENRIRTQYSSTNGFERKARKLPYINGTYLDYIFVTPMRVSEWETVVKIDSRGRFLGTIPSDHNMVRATVWLP